MTNRMLAALAALVIVVPTDVLAQQAPWVWPFPNPLQPTPPAPAPSPAAAPSATQVPTLTAPSGSPVVFELFTSRDCAACESAEYTANRLVAQPVAGARLIPLAYHVEFYGGASTTDPYVLPAATRRQQTYDAARGRVYTPQAIVDGDREFTGSEDTTARTAIAAAARLSKVNVEVSRAPRLVGPTSLALSVRYGGSGRRSATITAVLTESSLVEIHHGGLTDYDRKPLAPVVRSIQEVGPASPGGGTVETTLAIPAGAVRANLTAVVVLQDASSHHILGAGTLAAGSL